jgi:replicative DNA helicase
MLHNAELETTIVGEMLFDEYGAKTALSILRPNDFYIENNKHIAFAIYTLLQKGVPVDVVTLISQLEQTQCLAKAGGRDRIIEVATVCFTSANAKHHAVELQRLAVARRIHRAMFDLMQKQMTVADVEKLLADVKSDKITTGLDERLKERAKTLKEGLRIEHPLIKTGLVDIDNLIGGLRLGSVCIIGAYPSTGKTTFALNIAIHQTKPVVFFSLEMSEEAIWQRISSAEIPKDYGDYTHKKHTHDDFVILDKHIDSLTKRKFHVFDDVRYIEEQMRIVAEVKPCLVVVDFITKVRTHEKKEGKRLEVEHISSMYKQMAIDNNCAVIALSQLARPADKTKAIRPNMQMLRESGALEQDGDYIFMLFRKWVFSKDEEPTASDVTIEKNKYGNAGRVNLYFDGKHQRFGCVDKEKARMAQIQKKYAPRNVQEIEDDDSEMPF